MASRFVRLAAAGAAVLGLVFASNACHGNDVVPTGAATTTGGGASTSGATMTTSSTGAGGGSPVKCPTTITFQPGGVVSNPKIAGEWSGFDLAQATAMTGPTASGVYTATIDLAPGLQAYKVAYGDGSGGTTWALNPTESRRKYVNGVENSAIKVRDCSLPTFDVSATQATRPAAGSGTDAATLKYVAPIDGSPLDPAGAQVALVHDDASTQLSGSQAAISGDGTLTLALADLADGKYRVVVTPKAQSGKVGEPIFLVFWIEKEAFSWKDALIYMIVTDRYRDGDPSNDPQPIANADPRGDFKGGDLEGVRQSIADGTLDKLGVRALWLTPFNTNPPDAFIAADGVHMVSGYHGYWPVKARQVDPRIGGDAALHALVKEAHAHGIRILQDFVMNHVHQEHEYVAAHPDWFRMGCVCGTQNCDWTTHALDCLFAPYLPDVNHTVPAATAQFTADAVWWLDTFDLDGLRMDAVKHIEEVATRNTAAEVRETFERGGTRYFLMGETAMGWNDCADPCNDENYGTIAKYIGPQGLDGQFDFVLYHGVSYRTFAWGDKGMIHADYWFQHGQSKWPAGAIMTPYIGSHDTARFVTLSDYRGQDAAHDRSIPGNQWSNIAVAPSDPEPYRRARIGLAWLLDLPGAPLLYYGDEYGQWGGADPGNRLMWRPESALGPDEAATLAFVRALGTTRKTLPELRRGDYVPLLNTSDDTLVFARKVAQGDAAIVALTRLTTPDTKTFDVLGALGFASGTVLHDAMGGPDVTVASNGTVTVTVPASGVAILHP